MPYDNPLLKELGGYFRSEEPGRRERADAWATAIGLQQVDGLTPSRFLFDTAKEHIEGRITQNHSLGVAVSVGIAMLRILTGIPIYPFLIVGYVIALVITFFVPKIYTGIAFDSGGVASGPMTTTFMLPFAIGACEALGGNVMTDAFGIVAMVAMTPLIAIQLLGLHSRIKQHKQRQKIHSELLQVEDDMIYYEEV